MFFSQGTIASDGFSMVLLPHDHHHWMFFCRLTIDIDGFSMVFSQIQVRWLTMVLVMKRPKKRVNVKYFTTNLPNLQNTFHAPFHPFHFSSEVLICIQYLPFPLWLITNPDIIVVVVVGCCSRFCYHWKCSMVFRGTITIEWNGQRQPLRTMFFWWFWVSQPLVTMVFDGWPPSMQRWNCYIPSLKSTSA